MLQTKEIIYLKDHTDIWRTISLSSLKERGYRFIHYLLSPEDSSAGSGPVQNAQHQNHLHTLCAACKVLFWLTVSLTFTVAISNMA